MGGFTALSELPNHVFAFFANGGKRAWISRQVGAGAAKAAGIMANPIEEELLDTGDGVTVAFNGTLDNPPVRQVAAGGSITVSTYVDGVPVVAEASDMSPVPAGVAVDFTGKFGAAVTNDDTPLVPGTVDITDTTAPGQLYADYAPNSPTPGNGILYDAGNVARGYVDYQTGHFTLTTAIAPALPANVTYNYTPRGAAVSITDDGAGGWNAPAVAGAIDYTTGVWSLTFAAAPSNGWEILADYDEDNTAFELAWEGIKGNDIRVTVDGSPGHYTPSTASWDAVRIRIYEEDAGNGNFVLQETFDNVNMDDPTNARYISTLLNDEDVGSSLIVVTDPVDDEIPQSLNGLSRSRSIGGGNGVALDFGSSGATPTIANPFVTDPLSFPVQPRSVSFTYTGVSGTARTITDDGNGSLTGDVDPAAPAGYNVVDYDTGEFAFRVTDPPDTAGIAAAGSLVTGAWYEEPNATSVSDDATGGLDGTLPLTATELTAAALVANQRGIYALSYKVNELLNVVVPDAAGNTTMIESILAEAERCGLWFVIVAPPSGYTPAQVVDWRQNVLSYLRSWGALYYPWIRIQDPITNLPKLLAPGGHIAGKYAYNDTVANVGSTPAGKARGTLSWLLGFERKLDKGERDAVYPYQINILRDSPETGRVIWGARTLESPEADFKFLNARRVVNFVKLALYLGAFDFPFEDVGPSLWSRIRQYAEGFLSDLYRQKYFRGTTPKQAFFVICDSTNNDPDDNKVFCDVGVATKKPAEFVIFRVQLIAETSD